MVDDINNWLTTGCNYQVGLALLEQYGSNSFLLSLLKKSASDFNRQKLQDELQALLESAPPKVASVRPAEPLPSAPVPVVDPPLLQLGKPINHKAEPDLLQVIKQRDQSHAELRMLKALTFTTPEGPKLQELATRLVQLAKKNAELWTRYNYLSERPELEDDEPTPVPVMVDLLALKQREQVRKSLNKAENRVKRLQKEGKIPNNNTLALIQERRQQLADIDSKDPLRKVAQV